MNSRWMTNTLVVAATLVPLAAAQMPPAPNNARQQVVSEFDRKAPKVGDPVGQLELLDTDGRPFDLANLRGQYSVLVCGCLT